MKKLLVGLLALASVSTFAKNHCLVVSHDNLKSSDSKTIEQGLKRGIFPLSYYNKSLKNSEVFEDHRVLGVKRIEVNKEPVLDLFGERPTYTKKLVKFELVENQKVIFTSNLVDVKRTKESVDEIVYQIKVNKCD